jgi:hypothetical protein
MSLLDCRREGEQNEAIDSVGFVRSALPSLGKDGLLLRLKQMQVPSPPPWLASQCRLKCDE